MLRPLSLEPTVSASSRQAEWDFEVDNTLTIRKPVKSGFLVSFLVDARGGLVQAQRRMDLRFLIPPNAAPGPTRIVCRMLRPDRAYSRPSLNDGDSLASRLLEMGPYHLRFTSPILIEVPHCASLRGREREVIILRSDNGDTWKEHQVEATDQAVQDALGSSFGEFDCLFLCMN
ncbi:unnamed protein product [Protopolystoma xenopodis]|uniref:ZU5 domain-containing protein n=1 Tax=Protopolystoma xenopodis TaxID=117903 RepID=A0A3S5BDA0_9PLAT|nr:unnamed protein product [Protopolystoma xenopodis]